METTRLPGTLRRCILRLLLLVSLCGAATNTWAADPKVKFDLRPDEFPKAILEFYHQSKVEVLFLANDSLYNIRTQPVIGEFEPRDALERMLKGTGLTFDFDTDHSVIIKQPKVVAAAPPPPPPRAVERAPRRVASAEAFVPRDTDISEVLVTGSLIHTAMDMQAPVVFLGQSDFSKAPYPTVQDTLYQLPIVSLSSPREDLGLNNNTNYGAGINLRGLGVSATLVLVNGRRQPLSGLTGEFVDVSNIPMAAVERIEVLPEGASAIYGSDAVAGVVNIILKDDFQGAETQVRYGGTPGGRNDFTVSQLLGTRWDSGKAMLVYEYSDATDLPTSARGYAANANKTPYGGADYRSYFTDPATVLNPQTLEPSSTVNLQNQFARYEMFPQRTSHSIYGTATQSIFSGVDLFAEGRLTQRSTYVQHYPETQTLAVPAGNPFNPYGATTVVAYSLGPSLGPVISGSETRNYLGTFGAKFKYGGGWQGTLSESYGRETLFNNSYNEVDPYALSAALAATSASTAFNVFGPNIPSTLTSVEHNFAYHAVSALEMTSFVSDGPLFSLPAGDARLAVGLERRQESLARTVAPSVNSLSTENARYDRHVGSVFTELLIPVLGDAKNLHAPPRLELNLAARYDDYSDFGRTTNPEFKLRWVPFEWMKWRASWGRSYRAPTLDNLYDSSNSASGEALMSDPMSPTGRSTVLLTQGNNPNLKPEISRTWTVGLDLVPMADPGMKFSLTYYSIDYEGQIATPAASNPFDILVQESEWAAVIKRNPTQQQIAAICNRSDYYGSAAQCLASTPAAIVDYQLANLSSTKVTGLDLDLRQTFDNGAGHFNFGFNGSYVLHFDQAVTTTSPNVDILNTYGNPLKLRFRAVTGWSQHGDDAAGLGANLAVNYANGYDNPGSALAPRIDSLTTVDMQMRYRTPQPSGLWSGLELSLNAVNVFNQSPPFADNAFGYDSSNFQGLGRVLSLSIDKKW